ncbi:MAG TPA: hypothetical protein VK608_04665 [Edaphobacter sp.]|nr:hypothetical protein [Edaphobacter sp.]
MGAPVIFVAGGSPFIASAFVWSSSGKRTEVIQGDPRSGVAEYVPAIAAPLPRGPDENARWMDESAG